MFSFVGVSLGVKWNIYWVIADCIYTLLFARSNCHKVGLALGVHGQYFVAHLKVILSSKSLTIIDKKNKVFMNVAE